MNRYKLFQAGVNVNEALERLGGDKELYDDLLVHFKGSPRYTNLAQALEKGDVDEAFQLAHALKGTAGNLGFTRLFEALTPVVEALRVKNLELARASLPGAEAAYEVVIKAV